MENGTGQELVLADAGKDLAIARAPEVVLTEARNAAKALATVIAGKARKVVLNGKQYLEFEDWQTVAKFYGLVAKTGEAVPVEIDGVKGAKAKAEVVDVRTGEVLGGAESYCLRDEPNWKTKPWFQLASMAQTRAGAKALRNILSWVVVLAGYGTTPAEEMEGVARDEEPETIEIAHVEGKPNSRGQTWFQIKDIEGVEYLTTDKAIAEAATQAAENKQLVLITTHKSRTGKNMLDSIKPVVEHE